MTKWLWWLWAIFPSWSQPPGWLIHWAGSAVKRQHGARSQADFLVSIPNSYIQKTNRTVLASWLNLPCLPHFLGGPVELLPLPDCIDIGVRDLHSLAAIFPSGLILWDALLHCFRDNYCLYFPACFPIFLIFMPLLKLGTPSSDLNDLYSLFKATLSSCFLQNSSLGSFRCFSLVLTNTQRCIYHVRLSCRYLHPAPLTCAPWRQGLWFHILIYSESSAVPGSQEGEPCPTVGRKKEYPIPGKITGGFQEFHGP